MDNTSLFILFTSSSTVTITVQW